MNTSSLCWYICSKFEAIPHRYIEPVVTINYRLHKFAKKHAHLNVNNLLLIYIRVESKQFSWSNSYQLIHLKQESDYFYLSTGEIATYMFAINLCLFRGVCHAVH